ncbi:PREDICTED: coiled-coil domain-containing protein 87 [Elephantulus edwardii]|uniref:coiled-coil domain-containing protein 87 n=1 Tax=Elephantulus edwardii TaxID=28737 RepID=UPI0003F09713|nr:PREDICTED: coiled-coil domain-containing protein 87 [Elephantulus edwardii]
MKPRTLEPELQHVYHRLLQPLSLIPGRATPRESRHLDPRLVRALEAERRVKLTASSLCLRVAERLASSGQDAQVSPEGRHRLAEVILQELRCGWQEPPAEASLSPQNNQKLRQRLETYVLVSSEQLFLHYLHRLVALSGPDSVFTEPATLTRLATGLSRDCTLFLTGPDVYRGVLADFQALLGVHQGRGHTGPVRTFKLCPIPRPQSTGFAQVPCSSLDLNHLIHLSRPSEFQVESGQDPLKELKTIPQLKKKTTLFQLPSRPAKKSAASAKTVSLPSHVAAPSSQAAPSFQSPLTSQLRRYQSMPSLREGWKLADELGLLPQPPRTCTPLVLVAESKPELAENAVAEDLKKLMRKLKLKRPQGLLMDTDLHPLLGVQTRGPEAEHRLRELQRMLKTLEEEEEALELKDNQHLKTPPLHPQPHTTTLKLRNQLVVETAVVRVSDRKFVDSFHVEGVGVLYNHLTGELDSKLVEEMDRSHVVSDSTWEVYKELMSHISTNHLSFDQGPLIEPTTDKDWSACLSSSCLDQEKEYRIINPELAKLYTQGANKPRPHPSKTVSVSSLHGNKTLDLRSNKALWMESWWKANLSQEDYLKFLHTEKTDFLHVIFHMYKEEEPPPEKLVAPAKESQKLSHPLPLLEEKESWDFVPGEWDCRTVLPHGLGTAKLGLLSEYQKLPPLQKRLERLWSVLEFPHRDRLDMAIKYSSDSCLRQLPALLDAWEWALKPIRLREMLLAKLEAFEQQASNPNRFFQKPFIGLNCLVEESKSRKELQRQLRQVEASLVPLLEEIELIFHEPLTFRGRRYLDKMKHDQVEMLYWLQQRRRLHRLVQTQKAYGPQTAQSGRNSSQHLAAPGNTSVTL